MVTNEIFKDSYHCLKSSLNMWGPLCITHKHTSFLSSPIEKHPFTINSIVVVFFFLVTLLFHRCLSLLTRTDSIPVVWAAEYSGLFPTTLLSMKFKITKNTFVFQNSYLIIAIILPIQEEIKLAGISIFCKHI